MTEECCICFEEYNATVNYPLTSAKCNHTLCKACVVNLIEQLTEQQRVRLSVKCPLCRAKSPVAVWKTNIETLESSTLERLRNTSMPYDYRPCYVCSVEHPPTDLSVCITCEPDFAHHLLRPELSFILPKAFCSDCAVYHCLFHETSDNYSPLVIPLNILISPNSSTMLRMASSYLSTFQIHTHAPIVSVMIVHRFVLRELIKPMDIEILRFLLMHLTNSDFFMTIPEGNPETKQVPALYVVFVKIFLECLAMMTRTYFRDFNYDIIKVLLNVSDYIANIMKFWPDNMMEKMWRDYLHNIYCYSFHAILNLDGEIFSTQRIEIVKRFISGMSTLERCPAHQLLSEIVSFEIGAARRFPTTSSNQDADVEEYCNFISSRNQRFQSIYRFHNHNKALSACKEEYQITSTGLPVLS